MYLFCKLVNIYIYYKNANGESNRAFKNLQYLTTETIRQSKIHISFFLRSSNSLEYL